MEERHSVEVINISYRCAECSLGYMIATGIVQYKSKLEDPQRTSELLYQHQCNHCKSVVFIDKRYPYREEVLHNVIPFPKELTDLITFTGYNNKQDELKTTDIPKVIQEISQPNRIVDIDNTKPMIDLDSSQTVDGLDSSVFYKSSNTISTDTTVRSEPKEGYPLFNYNNNNDYYILR